MIGKFSDIINEADEKKPNLRKLIIEFFQSTDEPKANISKFICHSPYPTK